MFQSARLTLTSWYLAIIMMISMVFSLVIYRVINQELTRIERFQMSRLERQETGWMPVFEELRREREVRGLPGPRMPENLQDTDADLVAISEVRTRLKLFLIFVNLGIFALAGLAGYFLAGRTLQPIKAMVDEQKRFIGDVSHELRTPLTALRSEMEVGLRSKTLRSAEAKQLLKSNLEEIINLQGLTDNLITLTQYEKGEGRVPFESVSLGSVSAEALKKVAQLAKDKNITIRNLIEEVSIQGESQSLRQLFVIFLDNAIKYSPAHSTITLSCERRDDSVSVSIKDEGEGIDNTDLPHIFDRFYRADKSRSKGRVSGYGLGLSIAKQIVKRHKGTVKVESKKGKGTVFRLTFPAKRSV